MIEANSQTFKVFMVLHDATLEEFLHHHICLRCQARRSPGCTLFFGLLRLLGGSIIDVLSRCCQGGPLWWAVVCLVHVLAEIGELQAEQTYCCSNSNNLARSKCSNDKSNIGSIRKASGLRRPLDFENSFVNLFGNCGYETSTKSARENTPTEEEI